MSGLDSPTLSTSDRNGSSIGSALERAIVDPLLDSTASMDSMNDARSFQTHATRGLPSYCLKPFCGAASADLGRKNARRAAKATLLIVALFTAIAQWSALASGVTIFSNVLGLTNAQAAVATNSAFAICFSCSLIGGFLGDTYWGSATVLSRGLVFALISGFAASALQFPLLGNARDHFVLRFFIGISAFTFAAAIGVVQAAIPALVGDQCHDNPQSLGLFYALFYGFLQFGALVARISFPVVHYYYDFFIAFAFCLTSTLSLALFTWGLNVPVICYKAPTRNNVVGRAIRIVLEGDHSPFRCFIETATQDELEVKYGDTLVSETLRAVKVLKLHTPLIIFWALYFQMFSLWFLQSKQLDLTLWSGVQVVAEQVTAFNPLFDVVLLCFFGGFFALLKRLCGIRVAPKSKIMAGYIFAVLAFGAATVLQTVVAAKEAKGERHVISVYWQLPQFVAICAGEVLVYPSALHMVYIHAPTSMRTVVQSALWAFIGAGNILNMVVLGATQSIVNNASSQSLWYVYIGYTVAMVLACVWYFFMARRYDLRVFDAALAPPLAKSTHVSVAYRSTNDRQDAVLSQGFLSGGRNINGSFGDAGDAAAIHAPIEVAPRSAESSFAYGGTATPNTPQSRSPADGGSLMVPGKQERRRPVSPQKSGGDAPVYYSSRRRSHMRTTPTQPGDTSMHTLSNQNSFNNNASSQQFMRE